MADLEDLQRRVGEATETLREVAEKRAILSPAGGWTLRDAQSDALVVFGEALSALLASLQGEP